MKRKQLKELSFTDEFKAGEIFLDDSFNKLECKVKREDVYRSGEIMSVIVTLSDGGNKSIINTIVNNMDSYIELCELEGMSIKDGQIDLRPIIEYEYNELCQQVLYDWDNKEFI